jgi:hypothetical protein
MSEAGGFNHWWENRRASTRQFTEFVVDLDFHECINDLPTLQETTLRAAHGIVQHEFSFLGSGPFVAKDATRQQGVGSQYQFIDWFTDPIRSLTFPRDVPHHSWDLYSMRPGNADIKYPWELARCQHFLTLGQAYAISGNETFAREMIDQAQDFIQANPVGIGINWTCTMDVALRAVSWCIALPLVKSSKSISDDEWLSIYEHLFETGCFILANLEDKYEVTSNHFLSNLVGIYFLASEFRDTNTGASWNVFARERIEQEMRIQVLPDGADYESSIHYHRFVLELFLGPWRLSELQAKPLSEEFKIGLTKMLNYLEWVIDPKGYLPAIGDCDDGRLMIATRYGSWEPKSGVATLASAGAVLCDRSALARAIDLDQELTQWEAAWWGIDIRDRPNETIVDSGSAAKIFPDAGMVVARASERSGFLIVSNGPVGTLGFGNHKHNDLLSFEYHDQGVPVIVDPGSYVYTADFDVRNHLRSTMSHNTVSVDGLEQNDFRAEWLFRMFSKATPTHEAFTVDNEVMTYRGSYDGVNEGRQTFKHVRQFEYNFASGNLVIQDQLVNCESRTAQWSFHLHPDIQCVLDEHSRLLLLNCAGASWRFSWSDPGLQARLEPCLISPSYGVRESGTRFTLSTEQIPQETNEVRFEMCEHQC